MSIQGMPFFGEDVHIVLFKPQGFPSTCNAILKNYSLVSVLLLALIPLINLTICSRRGSVCIQFLSADTHFGNLARLLIHDNV